MPVLAAAPDNSHYHPHLYTFLFFIYSQLQPPHIIKYYIFLYCTVKIFFIKYATLSIPTYRSLVSSTHLYLFFYALFFVVVLFVISLPSLQFTILFTFLLCKISCPRCSSRHAYHTYFFFYYNFLFLISPLSFLDIVSAIPITTYSSAYAVYPSPFTYKVLL